VELDAIVVGAGPAGLAAALTLGRMRRRTLVVDTGEPRNRYTRHLHNFPSRDGLAPAELRRLMRKDVERYPSVELRDDRAVGAHMVEDGVELMFERGERTVTRRLVLASGVCDTLPSIEGLAELFGSSVFTCPYCDGYEAAGRPLGAICTKTGGQLVHWAGVLRLLGDDATVFANGVAVADEERAAADTLGVSIVEAPVVRLRADGDGVGIVLSGGREERRTRLFVPTEVQPSNRLAEQLGCAMREAGFIEVDELGRTTIPRVYAAGDAASPVHQAVIAAASGTRAALTVNDDALEAFELS
jgi:thioredoxin reductase